MEVMLKKVKFDGLNVFLNLNHIIITFESSLELEGNKLKIYLPHDAEQFIVPKQNVKVNIEIIKEVKT
jgi:hypothetical protein